MSKPSIFFSHSAKDGSVLAKLKKAVSDATGNTFDIFLSSDGQSIPFGRNWVYEIQDALERTSAVFVFLSPQSIASNWIFFESGYAYSKNIRVIPVGIMGVSIGAVPPPLGLLNGFDIKDYDGLNKLIVTINDALEHDHKHRFDSEEYQAFFGDGESLSPGGSLPAIEGLYLTQVITGDVVEFGFSSDKSEKTISEFLSTLSSLAEREGWQYSRTSYTIQFSGMTVSFFTQSFNETRVEISAYGPAIFSNAEKIQKLVREGIKKPYTDLRIEVTLFEHFEIECNINRRTHLFENTEIKLCPGGGVEFRGYGFDLLSKKGVTRYSSESPARLIVHPKKDELDLEVVKEFLLLLDRVNILKVDE